jgi:GDPmannose 4,6-dehydratase
MSEYNGMTALITGITGMDGSHLADFLLAKGYRVCGLERRLSTKNHINISHIKDKITLFYGDLEDSASISEIINICEPDEIYNLAAQSFVGASWDVPIQTSNITGLGALRILEAIRKSNKNHIKFYQASSSEMFGKMDVEVANEETSFYPRSPYGVAKVYAHWITKNYRESFNMFNCCGILFNHESERRGLEFVTRKITDGVAKIYYGHQDYIELGNIDSKRDWGYAPDYVEAMWLMMQHETPDDYVVATNEVHSIREFLDIAFTYVGIPNYENCIRINPLYIRPADVNYLRGDYTKINNTIGWEPKTKFVDLVHKMMDNDLRLSK